MNPKITIFLFLVSVSCFVARSAQAAEVCWITHATQQDDGPKLFFRAGNESVARVVVHSDGTRSKAVNNPDGSFTLKKGDRVLLSDLLHSQCYATAARQDGVLGLRLSGSTCMPGLKCQSSESFMPLVDSASDDAEADNSSKRRR